MLLRQDFQKRGLDFILWDKETTGGLWKGISEPMRIKLVAIIMETGKLVWTLLKSSESEVNEDFN